MKAVIMAGGEGTRLRPLTCNLPKPMVPVVNKPMMEHILNLLKQYQFKEIANTLWFMPEIIKDYFGDGSEYGVDMHYFIEDKPLGTAGSVKNAASFLNETFVVVSGDCLTDINLQAALEFHRQKKSMATLVLTRVANPLSYGVVITNEDDQIIQFLEKPAWSEVFSDTVNTGIYILEPEVLANIPENVKYDFSQDLFPQLLAKHAPLYGYVAEGYWSDVGNLQAYRQAQLDCLDGKVKIDLPKSDQQNLWIDSSAHIAADAEIYGPAYIGKQVEIGSGCMIRAYSIIGDHCQISGGVKLKRSTLWQGVKIGSDTKLSGVICANNVFIDKKVQAYEGSVIGAKSIIGNQVKLEPNVKVWPNKQIISGSHLVNSIIWGSQTEPALFSATGVKGDIRSVLTPEMMVRFGLAYGNFVGVDNKLVISSDSSKAGRLAKRAVLSGILAAGVHVYDVGSVSGNLTRFGVEYIPAQGGLHCQKVSDQENQIAIQCWDHRGYWLSKAEQRKIENTFWREDFPRVSVEQLGNLAFIPGLIKQYVINIAKIYAPRLQGFRVKVKADQQELATLVTEFLTLAGCEIIDKDPNFIVEIENDHWKIKDPSGSELTEDQWWELFVRGQGSQDRKQIPVPAHVSSHVSKVAQEYGAEIKWTKTDPRSWMEMAAEFGEFVHFPYIEPVASIGEALSYLKLTDKPWQELYLTSSGNRVHTSVFCPWESKGKVMRAMIKQTDPASTTYLDGIKQENENGSVLIIPDGDEPLFHIYSEATTGAEAESITQFYANQLGNIINEGGDSN